MARQPGTARPRRGGSAAPSRLGGAGRSASQWLIAMAHGHARVRGVECLISTPFSPNVSECVRDMSQTYEISLCCDLFTFDLNQLPVTYLDFEVFHVCLILSHPT